MAATDVSELCEKAGIRNPERFTSLGITTASDVMQIDLVGELPLLEQRGITYMEMKKLKTAAEGQEVAKGPVTVTVPATRMDMMAPPAEFVDKFASLAHGCYCWRVVEQIKADRKTQECVLVVTQEFLLVCSLAGAITTVMRCQDVELVALQEGSPSVLAIKAFPKCCEPTVVVSLLANAKNPVNDPMHPVHSLNFVRKRTVKADINLIKVPTTMHIHNLPVLAGSFEEGENYITPHMKFQILQQTKSWPNGGASSLPNFEFVYKSADGTTNTVRLGKNFGKEFGSTGKFQWYVDGKARMPDIREVRYEAATQELSFRKNDTSLKPGLPAEESARYQCLKSIGALAARARIRCTGLPKDSRRRKKEESYQFTDLAGVTHKLTPNPKGGVEWWMGPSMFQVKALNYNQKTSQLVGGTVGPTALLKDAEVLQRVLDLVTSAGVTCTGFNDTKEASGSYSHNPYPAPGDPDAMSDLPTSPRLSFTGSPRETPTNGLMTSPNPSPAPDADELGMSGLALMQPKYVQRRRTHTPRRTHTHTRSHLQTHTATTRCSLPRTSSSRGTRSSCTRASCRRTTAAAGRTARTTTRQPRPRPRPCARPSRPRRPPCRRRRPAPCPAWSPATRRRCRRSAASRPRCTPPTRSRRRRDSRRRSRRRRRRWRRRSCRCRARLRRRRSRRRAATRRRRRRRARRLWRVWP